MMARLTISDAIKQSGVARSTFYSKYIKHGLISVSEHSGKKYIDSSELVRVFPDLTTKTTSNNIEQPLADVKNNIERLEKTQLQMEIKLLRDALGKAEEDKQWLKEQNSTLLLRLEAPRSINPIAKWWRGLK